MSDDAYCPHCRMIMRRAAPHPYPASPTRCQACLLLVSAGRACGEQGQRRVPRAIDAVRRAKTRPQRPGPVTAGPTVDVVQAVMREVVHTHRSVL